MKEAPSIPPTDDSGEVVPARHGHVSWVWLFPILALAATSWLFWKNWSSLGPEITINFVQAPGMQPRKTALVYRGVQAGTVTAVDLLPDLKGVAVTVRLREFAAELATEDTDFWIEEPVFSLKGVSGVESIIQGNSIRARRRGDSQVPRRVFDGLAEAPVTPLDTPALLLNLRADQIPFVVRGAPLNHRGVRVGWVRDKSFGPDGRPLVQIVVAEQFIRTVRSTSRFWIEPATTLQASPGEVKLIIPALSTLFDGGISFDTYSPGSPVRSGMEFDLHPDEFSARADGPRLQVTFTDGSGLRAGQTRVCHQGQPVGLVESIRTVPGGREVRTVVRLQADYAAAATAGSIFEVVRPRIDLDGVTGLDTIVTGPYIAFEPGPADGPPLADFTGREESPGERALAEAEAGGLQLVLRAAELPALEAGAPVYHRGLTAGRVLSRKPGADGRPEMTIVVQRDFREAVRANARFWRVPATAVQAGPGVLEVQVQGLRALWQGGVAFEVFGEAGPPAPDGASFALHDNEDLAAAVSPPVRISFDNGQGLLAGRTQLRYLGLPVGVVETVEVRQGRVDLTARFRHGYDFLRRAGSEFAIVRPDISVRGAYGLETFVSGVYIICSPGRGKGYPASFTAARDILPAGLMEPGLEIRLLINSTALGVGAPVTYNETEVGEVIGKSLTADGSQIVLTAKVRPEYVHLVRTGSVFWEVPGVEAKIGPFKVQIKTQSLLTPNGRVAFATPDGGGTPVKPGQEFQLAAKPPKPLKRP